MERINDILERYADLLDEVDRWFGSCLHNAGETIACKQGCSSCCRGLFDITLLDALYLKRGVDLLPDSVREKISEKAAARLSALSARWPLFSSPWILNQIPEDLWHEMMPEDDQTPCLLLSPQGTCLAYAFRPMTCRLNGIPQIDTSGESLSDEWCSLNFAGLEPHHLMEIRYPFKDVFTQELLLFRELTNRLFGKTVNELDTIIPTAVFLDSGTVARIRPPNLHH